MGTQDLQNKIALSSPLNITLLINEAFNIMISCTGILHHLCDVATDHAKTATVLAPTCSLQLLMIEIDAGMY